MRSCGEHNAALRLVCGEDRFLSRLVQVMAIAAVVFTALGGLPIEVKLLLILSSLVVLRVAPGPVPDGAPLLLMPDGCSICANVTGRVNPVAWVSNLYTVVRLDQEHGRRFVVICASQQNRDEYRKLLAWLRLKRWQEEG